MIEENLGIINLKNQHLNSKNQENSGKRNSRKGGKNEIHPRTEKGKI